MTVSTDSEKYRYIARVGIELEGGWNGPTRPANMQHDGSVNVTADWVGEVASEPLLPNEIDSWMATHYPSTSNQSCGMHVHVSFRTLYQYSRLMEKEFHEYLKVELKKWGTAEKIIARHPFWARLEGKNSYCQDEFCPEEQMHHKDKGGKRYAHLNYAWSRYKTIECRLMPMFLDPLVGVSAVKAVIRCFEGFLKLPHERARPAKLTVPPDLPDRDALTVDAVTIDLSPDTDSEAFLATAPTPRARYGVVLSAEERRARLDSARACTCEACAEEVAELSAAM